MESLRLYNPVDLFAGVGVLQTSRLARKALLLPYDDHDVLVAYLGLEKSNN
jgi:hypothetical protein